MAETLNELLVEVQDLAAKLEVIVFGSDVESVTHNSVTRPTLQKELADKFNAIQALVQGSIPYETKAAMDAAGSPPGGELAIVWNDSIANNNGQYGYTSGAWVSSKYDPTNATRPANILFDSFNEYVADDPDFGGWSWFSNQLHTIDLASVNNPFPTPAIKRGTANNIDRRWDYSKLGLSAGDLVTVSVPCWMQDSGGKITVFFRQLDNTVLAWESIYSLSVGYSNESVTITVPAGSIHKMMIRVEQSSGTEFEVFGYFACQGNSKPQMIRSVSPKSYGSSAADIGIDNSSSDLSSVNIEDSVHEVNNKFGQVPFLNLVPDAFHRQLAAGITQQLGYPTVNQAVGLVDFSENPFSTRALHLPIGQGNVDRNIDAQALGLKLGDKLSVKIGVYGSNAFSIGSYFRSSGGAVIGTAGTIGKTITADYGELFQTHTITQEILDSAAYLQVRLLPPSGGVTSDAYICAWAVYRGDIELPIQDASYLEDESQIKSSPGVLSADIVLPSEYPVLAGSGEESNIYFNYALKGIFNSDQVDISSTYGAQLEECWRLKPVTDDAVAGGDSFSLTLKLSDDNRGLIKSAVTSVKVVEPVDTGAVRLLVIGDSITRHGGFVKQVQDVLPNCEAVGIRQYGGEVFAREGRGGWQLAHYCTRFGELAMGDSPFLFPVGVAGNLYFGNTNQWLSIMNDSGAYDHSGFQRIAKDWDDAGSYQYDLVTGRRLNPPEGAVMYDPALGSYIEYTLGAWAVMAVQPASVEFDFSKYSQRFATAFTAGAPTHVAIMSGANDFFYDGNGISDAEWAQYLGYLNTIFDSIAAYSSSIKRIIVLPICGAGQDGAGAYKDSGPSSYQFNYTMKQLSRRIIDQFDNQSSRDLGIHIAPLITSLDPVGGFPFANHARNKYVSDMTVGRQTDQLHPRNEGHYQMGDCLAATVQWCRV